MDCLNDIVFDAFEDAQERWFQLAPESHFLAKMPVPDERLAFDCLEETTDEHDDPPTPQARGEWKAYLAGVDVNDERTPRERLREFFS